MQRFAQDEAGYRAWVGEHPAGFVVNHHARPKPHYLILHRATCHTITGTPPRGTTWTTPYVKRCADERTELENWAMTALGASLQPCRICFPTSVPGRDREPPRPQVEARLREASRELAPSEGLRSPRAPQAAPTAWALWEPASVERTISGLEPRLASWNRHDHPDQIRLHQYLEFLAAQLGSLTDLGDPLFLHLQVALGSSEQLLVGRDLENYLTPVVRRLGSERFCLVSATKQVVGGSSLTVGRVRLRAVPAATHGWQGYAFSTSATASSGHWQTALRVGLTRVCPAPLEPGPVEVHLAWRLGPGRQWTNLWKPTGDAMGPVVGEPRPGQPFHPHDDRITRLWLHRVVDPARGAQVDCGLWWRPAD